MGVLRSKITSQGQISVPGAIRKRLGIGPGSILEWEEEGDRIVVRRSGSVNSEDIHRALFPSHEPKPKSVKQLKEGIREYARKRSARG
jgi:AbrB family looped-hinge helix DNA binding protein